MRLIFVWPGIGSLALNAIFNRDYPVIQGYVLWMAIIFCADKFNNRFANISLLTQELKHSEGINMSTKDRRKNKFLNDFKY